MTLDCSQTRDTSSETVNGYGGRSRGKSREKSVVKLATFDLHHPGFRLIGSGQGSAAASLQGTMALATVMVCAAGHISPEPRTGPLLRCQRGRCRRQAYFGNGAVREQAQFAQRSEEAQFAQHIH